MPLYEVFIKPGHRYAEIEADNADDAAAIFAERVREDLSVEHIEANRLEDDE